MASRLIIAPVRPLIGHTLGKILLILGLFSSVGMSWAEDIAAVSFADSREAETQILQFINQLRLEAGMRPLFRNTEASTAALVHARYLGSLGKLSHIGADGLRVTERYRMFGGTGLSAGENLGAGDSGETVVRAWMSSPSHRNNLLDPRWFSAGAAVHTLDSGRVVVTVIFTGSRWDTLEYSAKDEALSMTGRLLLDKGAIPRSVAAVIDGIAYPAEIAFLDETGESLTVTFDIPYTFGGTEDLSDDRSQNKGDSLLPPVQSYLIRIREKGIETDSDLVFPVF